MSFLLLAPAAFFVARRARAQDDVDPASSAARQALRVLLGQGDAQPSVGQTFSFDGKLYRGTFERTPDGQIVDLVDLEGYLYSVVPREMPSSWPVAALEAQSICARTYVLQRSDPRRAYDLVPSEVDQRYDGLSAETPASVAAVDATAGSVLSFAGAFAQIAYSSCCGGHTESAFDAWGSSAPPYLSGVTCTSCSDSPNYRWQRTLAFDAIGSRLSGSLATLGNLNDVRIAERDGSGRARTIELLTDRGSTVVSGSAFRRAVGSRVLPSLLLTDVQRAPDGSGILFTGGGLGHGVGFCQWGARGMALAGRQPSEILTFYFPGTGIQNLAQHR
ncbi:MAG: SpoIID/LytB domain-containing protein [Candidatus Cybelea sp.]